MGWATTPYTWRGDDGETDSEEDMCRRAWPADAMRGGPALHERWVNRRRTNAQRKTAIDKQGKTGHRSHSFASESTCTR